MTIRLNPETIGTFKVTAKEWQSRISDILDKGCFVKFGQLYRNWTCRASQALASGIVNGEAKGLGTEWIWHH